MRRRAERSRFRATRKGGCGYGQRVSTSGKPLSARVRFRSASGPARVAPKRFFLLGEFVAQHPPDRGLLIGRPGVGLADRARQVGESGVELARPAQGVLAGAGHPKIEELSPRFTRSSCRSEPAWLVASKTSTVAPAFRQSIFELPQVVAETLGLVDGGRRLVRCRRGSRRAGPAARPGRRGEAVESGSRRISMSTRRDRLAPVLRVAVAPRPQAPAQSGSCRALPAARSVHRLARAASQPPASPSRAVRRAWCAAAPGWSRRAAGPRSPGEGQAPRADHPGCGPGRLRRPGCGLPRCGYRLPATSRCPRSAPGSSSGAVRRRAGSCRSPARPAGPSARRGCGSGR